MDELGNANNSEQKIREKHGLIWRILHNPNQWVLALGAPLIIFFVVTIWTGFLDLSFGKRSFEAFGISNEAPEEGAYLKDDTVYKLPLNQKFKIEGDIFLTIREYIKYNDEVELYATVTYQNGRTNDKKITPSQSLYSRIQCGDIAVHLMRNKKADEENYLILYTRTRDDTDECRSWFGRMMQKM